MHVTEQDTQFSNLVGWCACTFRQGHGVNQAERRGTRGVAYPRTTIQPKSTPVYVYSVGSNNIHGNMSLLERHLEQIALSSESIGALP
jgi:hypothetical protein